MIKPNTVLPKGGKLLKPLKAKIGGWVEMEFDAEVQVSGVRWLRVKGGMGERGDREDWVADAPLAASTHDYQWRKPYWGSVRYASFEQGCRAEFASSLERLQRERTELESRLAIIRETIKKHATRHDPPYPLRQKLPPLPSGLEWLVAIMGRRLQMPGMWRYPGALRAGHA